MIDQGIEYRQKTIVIPFANEELSEIIDSEVAFNIRVDKNTVIIELSFGSKKLLFKIYETSNQGEINVGTWLENVDLLKKQTGETALLYQQVKKICQALVDKNKRVNYTLSTANPSLQDWAEKGKGLKLFNWDTTEYFIEENLPSVLTCTKIFLKQQ